jgi:hypothetical protein
VASTRKVWFRDLVWKTLVTYTLVVAGILATGSLDGANLGVMYLLIGGAFVLFNAEARALWDYLAGTSVLYHPRGLTASSASSTELLLQQLESLRRRNRITDAEYLKRRREILAPSEAGRFTSIDNRNG